MTVRQIWIGGTDLAGVLFEVGGWWVGSERHQNAAAAVQYGLDHGMITHRTHYAPAVPEGEQAFEVTDLGIQKLREWGWPTDGVERTRQWYRDNASRAPV